MSINRLQHVTLQKKSVKPLVIIHAVTFCKSLVMPWSPNTIFPGVTVALQKNKYKAWMFGTHAVYQTFNPLWKIL